MVRFFQTRWHFSFVWSFNDAKVVTNVLRWKKNRLGVTKRKKNKQRKNTTRETALLQVCFIDVFFILYSCVSVRT